MSLAKFQLFRRFYSDLVRKDRFRRVWNAGGYTTYEITRVEFTDVSTLTAIDSTIDLNTGLAYNGMGPFWGGVYVSEGYDGGVNHDDVDRIVTATNTITNDVADSGAIRAGSGTTSAPMKLWIIGGSTTSYYDDVAEMNFSNESMTLITSGQISAARTRLGAIATAQKVMSVGGLETGATEVTTIEGWPHSTETLADISDLNTAHDWVVTNLSDTAMYATADAENERMSLATLTVTDVNSPPATISETMGNGTFGTGALRMGGSISGTPTNQIHLLSFATETWVDVTDMTLATEKVGPCAG